MSEQPDDKAKPADIDVIRDLLRQLEEVAAKDADKPTEVKPTASAIVPRNELASLSRNGAPAAVAAPQLPLIVPPSSGEIVAVPTLLPPALTKQVEERQGRSGVAVAALSFGLGIATAVGVLFMFGPLGQSLWPVRNSAGPAVVATASPQGLAPPVVARVEPTAPAAEATRPAMSSVPEPEARIEQREPSSPTAADEPARASTEAVVEVPPPSVVLPSEPPRIDLPLPAPVRVVASPPPPIPTAPAPAAPKLPAAVKTAPPATSTIPPANGLNMPARVALRAGESRATGLRIEPVPASDSTLLLVVRNVPGWLTFSKGGAIGNGVWLMPAHAADGLEWIVAGGAEGSASLKLQLAAADGRMVAEMETAVEVSRSVPAQTAPMVAGQELRSQEQRREQPTEQELQRLLARGALLIETGEIEAARTLLRSAAESGSVAAALKLAETYDPAEIPRLGLAVASADPLLAVRWYVHAEALGSKVATARLAALGRR
jgi:hypothetical protein